MVETPGRKRPGHQALKVVAFRLGASRTRALNRASEPVIPYRLAVSSHAARNARDDRCGNTDAEEIARWHRQWVDDVCIPTQETTEFCPRLGPRADSGTDEGLRRWNGLTYLRLDDASVYLRRGRSNGPHSYEVCKTGEGWTLVEHGVPANDRECTNHLIQQSAEAAVRCAESLGGATKSAEALQAELRENARQESEAHNRTAR